MAFIYKITNDVNNKVYIGKTNYSIEKRFKEHCSDALKHRCEKRPLYSAMRKYGFEHFHIEQLEEVTTEMAPEKEKYWIEQYNSFHNGYNATIGGDGKNYVDYNKLVDLYNNGYNVSEIHSITNHAEDTIRFALHNSGITHEQIYQRARKSKRRPVAQIDISTNKPIRVFETSKAANKEMNTRIIPDVCKGKKLTCKGYKWEYVQISDLIEEE